MTGMSYRRTLFGDVQQAALRVLLGHNKARSGTFRVAEQGSALPFSAIPEKCPVVVKKDQYASPEKTNMRRKIKRRARRKMNFGNGLELVGQSTFGIELGFSPGAV